MNHEQERERFVNALENIVGYPYIWGGEDPEVGFDCSGALRYCWLQSGFKMERDMTAFQMCTEFWAECRIDHAAALPGDLTFYGLTPESVTHVMIILRKWPNGKLILSGARGGDSKTLTCDVAYKEWALVDIQSQNYWLRNLQYTVNPFLKLHKEKAEPAAIEATRNDIKKKIAFASGDPGAVIHRTSGPKPQQSWLIRKIITWLSQL